MINDKIKNSKREKLLKNKRGMSGVEFVVAVVIVGLIVTVIYDVLKESINTWKYQDVQTNALQQARNAISKMSKEIRQAQLSSITITTLDANRDRIQFSAPLELENPEDVQEIIYEPQLNGNLQRTVTYAAGGSDTNVVAAKIDKLYFSSENEGQIAIRVRVNDSNQIINLAAKTFPRNY